MEQIVELKKSLNQRLEEAYQKCNDKGLDSDEARIIFDKLRGHYKLRGYYIEFTDRLRSHTGFCWSYGKIQVRYRTSFETLCHEVAHAIDFSKGRYKKFAKTHTKRFYRLVKRVCLYCANHNFWQDEVCRRTEIKIKPEPTKQEIRQLKIQKKEVALIRYEKKLNYYNKLYSNKIKKARRSLAMLRKHEELCLSPHTS